MHNQHLYLAGTKHPRRWLACDRLQYSSPLLQALLAARLSQFIIDHVRGYRWCGVVQPSDRVQTGALPEIGGAVKDGDGLWRSVSSRGVCLGSGEL